MSLTGLPLLILVGATAIAAAAGTARTWHRHGHWQPLTRPAAVLLTEALALLTAGLAVNRAEQFYPTWADLLPADAARHDIGPVRPGHLDRWITAQAERNPSSPVIFRWQPAQWTRWPVTAAPIVVVPAAYPRHPTWRYPVVTVLADHDTTSREADAANEHTAGAIVVFARLRPTATADTLTDSLPASVAHDLRVTTHSWALVAPTHLAGLARATVRAAPTRYPALALIDDPTNPGAVPADLPATETVTLIGAPIRGPDDPLPAALQWACQHTPAPLNASAPPHPPPPDHPRPDPAGGTHTANGR